MHRQAVLLLFGISMAAAVMLSCTGLFLSVCFRSIISAMGTGNKLDAQQLRIADLSKTEGCPLARVVRKELKARGIVHHPVVFSPELPSRAHDGTETPPPGRRSIPASSMWVPASAGLLLAQWVISYLTDEKTAH